VAAQPLFLSLSVSSLKVPIALASSALHPGETVTPSQEARPKPPSPEDQARMLKMGGVYPSLKKRQLTQESCRV